MIIFFPSVRMSFSYIFVGCDVKHDLLRKTKNGKKAIQNRCEATANVKVCICCGILKMNIWFTKIMFVSLRTK